jgi:hypothetical protein
MIRMEDGGWRMEDGGHWCSGVVLLEIIGEIIAK